MLKDEGIQFEVNADALGSFEGILKDMVGQIKLTKEIEDLSKPIDVCG